MSTFAKATFNATVYSSSRPTYPSQLFEYIFNFHRAGSGSPAHRPRWERAVDIGCGTGQATTQLHPFNEVIGIDPSPGMLEKAKVFVGGNAQSSKFKFLQGSAEDLRAALPEDESVDLMTAAQAAHWFNWNKVWPETQRILRPGGTAAFWVYTEFCLSNHPNCTPIITGYAQGTDPETSLGPHFQRPGRTILERHLVDVPEPSNILNPNKLGTLNRTFFCGSEVPDFLPDNPVTFPVFMKTEMRWRDLLSYFRTMSALHTYHELFPEDLEREPDTRFLEQDMNGDSEGLGGGDIAIRFWKDLRERVLIDKPDTKVGADDTVQVEWPVALLLIRKE